jgi:DNA (cytosine-5)-methyltransferase 1
LLDLGCKAGGTSMGFYRAGFDVVGVDIEPQPNYPFEFHQADFLTYPLDGFDAIVAGPVCKGYSTLHNLHKDREYPKLIAEVRQRLIVAGVPYVIENVVGARWALIDPIRLCGSSFGLGVRRHRLFELSFPIGLTPPCAHHLQPAPVDVTGTGARRLGERTDGKGGNSRKPFNLAHAREVMGIDWMSREELAQAIPPAYTEWIGEQMLDVLAVAA